MDVVVWSLSFAGMVVIVALLIMPSEARTQARLRAVEQDLRRVMKHLGVKTAAEEAIGDRGAEIEALLRQGRKIQAIKLYRELTGEGLKESKEAVEAMERA